MKNCTELKYFYCEGNSFTNIPNEDWGNKQQIRRECASIFDSEAVKESKRRQAGVVLRLWIGMGGKEGDLTGRMGHDELAKWKGIETNADGMITRINWSSKGLSGTIAEEPLGQLTALTTLDLK